ncbi:MAG: hypothetical protein MRJ96_15035 [Nitrospirales bacterium]|nr:hypothetical protein [Nitrospira sp.]MDR4502756.1 hypothetical protein [Nitrospirales bacterium]
MQYDAKFSLTEANLLLLNIARSKYHFPIHFTTVPNIAASFEFRADTGFRGSFFANPTAGSDQANIYGFDIGASVSERPTIFITPVQGEDFTKRLLTPMDETKFEFLVHQGVPLAMLLRIMALGIVIDNHGIQEWFPNTPSQPEHYLEFRKRVLHLASLETRNQIDLGPIEYDRVWPKSTSDNIDPQEIEVAYTQGYRWADTEQQDAVLKKRVVGRMLLANYRPSQLSNKARRALEDRAMQFPRNFILIDIHPEFPGGAYPLQGWIKLRSFRGVLGFIAEGIDEYPEFHVNSDSRTEKVNDNPVRTLAIEETPDEREEPAFSVRFQDKYYSISSSSKWDLKAFEVLHQLFQMTVSDVTKVPAPPITIAK